MPVYPGAPWLTVKYLTVPVVNQVLITMTEPPFRTLGLDKQRELTAE